MDSDVVRVVLQFKDFTTLTRFVFSNKHQSSGFNPFNQVRVDFVSMAVPLVNGFAFTVELANGLSFVLPEGGAASKAHGAAKVCFRYFWHEDDSGVVGIVFEFCRICTFHSENVSAEFNSGYLQS